MLHAPLLAEADWSYSIEVAVGRSAAYAPADQGLPADGVAAQGDWNAPSWLVQTLDLSLTREVRRRGQVLNWRDREAAQARAVWAAPLAAEIRRRG